MMSANGSIERMIKDNPGTPWLAPERVNIDALRTLILQIFSVCVLISILIMVVQIFTDISDQAQESAKQAQ
jgi:hypothetical protein